MNYVLTKYKLVINYILRLTYKIDYFLYARFLAAFFVIRQHVNFDSSILYIGNYHHFLFGSKGSGYYAVHFFFILSGYLMAKVLDIKYLGEIINLDNIKVFYVNRIARIFPLYYFIVLISSWFMFSYTMSPFNRNWLQPYLLLTMQYNMSFVYNQVIWSVGIEMLFYLICPFIAIILNFVFKKNLYIILLLLIISFYLMYNNFVVTGYNKFLELFKLTGIMSKYIPGISSFTQYIGLFLIGYTGYYLISKAINLTENIKFSNSFLALRSLILIIFPYFIFTTNWTTNIPFWFELIFGLIILFFILIVEIIDFKSTKKPKCIINHLGNLSYGIYLVHMLVLIRFNEAYGAKISETLPTSFSSIAILIIVSIISIICAEFLYNTVEKPGAKIIIKFFNSKN